MNEALALTFAAAVPFLCLGLLLLLARLEDTLGDGLETKPPVLDRTGAAPLAPAPAADPAPATTTAVAAA